MIPQYFKAAASQMTLELAHFANIFPQKKMAREQAEEIWVWENCENFTLFEK